jgi:hypothetical protein
MGVLGHVLVLECLGDEGLGVMDVEGAFAGVVEVGEGDLRGDNIICR